MTTSPPSLLLIVIFFLICLFIFDPVNRHRATTATLLQIIDRLDNDRPSLAGHGIQKVNKWIHPGVFKANVPITVSSVSDSFTHKECVQPQASEDTSNTSAQREIFCVSCQCLSSCGSFFLWGYIPTVLLCLCTYLHNRAGDVAGLAAASENRT